MSNTNTLSFVRKYRKPAIRTSTPRRSLASWQVNADTLTESNIQLWQGDSMSCVVPLESAKKCVESGYYACINEQAIYLR